MKIIFFSIAILFAITINISARPITINLPVQQSTAMVKGTITEKGTGEPLSFATIALIQNDNNIVSGTIANAGGKFELHTAKGIYSLKISLIGYKTVQIPIDMRSVNVVEQNIAFEEDNQQIDEVVVKADLPQTEIKNGAIVTNVAGSILEHAGNAKDVLERVPGMILKSDELEVIGRGAPLYYINGRKVTDNDELRNLMAEDIKSIEIISNPGAAYDAEVKSVVIIRTIKRQGDGISYALTSEARQQLTINNFQPSWTVLDLNYRKNGLDLIGKVVFVWIMILN